MFRSLLSFLVFISACNPQFTAQSSSTQALAILGDDGRVSVFVSEESFVTRHKCKDLEIPETVEEIKEKCPSKVEDSEIPLNVFRALVARKLYATDFMSQTEQSRFAGLLKTPVNQQSLILAQYTELRRKSAAAEALMNRFHNNSTLERRFVEIKRQAHDLAAPANLVKEFNQFISDLCQKIFDDRTVARIIGDSYEESLVGNIFIAVIDQYTPPHRMTKQRKIFESRFDIDPNYHKWNVSTLGSKIVITERHEITLLDPDTGNEQAIDTTGLNACRTLDSVGVGHKLVVRCARKDDEYTKAHFALLGDDLKTWEFFGLDLECSTKTCFLNPVPINDQEFFIMFNNGGFVFNIETGKRYYVNHWTNKSLGFAFGQNMMAFGEVEEDHSSLDNQYLRLLRLPLKAEKLSEAHTTIFKGTSDRLHNNSGITTAHRSGLLLPSGLVWTFVAYFTGTDGKYYFKNSHKFFPFSERNRYQAQDFKVNIFDGSEDPSTTQLTASLPDDRLIFERVENKKKNTLWIVEP